MTFFRFRTSFLEIMCIITGHPNSSRNATFQKLFETIYYYYCVVHRKTRKYFAFFDSRLFFFQNYSAVNVLAPTTGGPNSSRKVRFFQKMFRRMYVHHFHFVAILFYVCAEQPNTAPLLKNEIKSA